MRSLLYTLQFNTNTNIDTRTARGMMIRQGSLVKKSHPVSRLRAVAEALSEAKGKGLSRSAERSFAEFTLSGAHVLRMTGLAFSAGEELSSVVEPCLNIQSLIIRIDM